MIHRKLSYRNASGKTLGYIYRGEGHEHAVIDVYHVASQSFAQDPIIRGEDGIPMEIDIDLMEAELDNLAEKNQRSNLRFAHYIVSLPAHEKLSLEQWEEVVRFYLTALGYGVQSKWTAVLHTDTDNHHVHILVCRVVNDLGLGYRLVSDSNDHERGMVAMRALEGRFGLTVTANPAETWGVDLDVRTFKRLEKADRLSGDDDGWIKRIRTRLAHAVEQSEGGTFSGFLQNCREHGIDPIVKIHPDGYPVGISYGFDGRYLSGSKIKSTRLTLPALIGQKYCSEQKKMMPTGRLSEGITYDHARDFPAAKLCSDNTPTKRDFVELGSTRITVSPKMQNDRVRTEPTAATKGECQGGGHIAGAPLSQSCATASGKSGVNELLTLHNLFVDLALNAAHAKTMRRLRERNGVGLSR